MESNLWWQNADQWLPENGWVGAGGVTDGKECRAAWVMEVFIVFMVVMVVKVTGVYLSWNLPNLNLCCSLHVSCTSIMMIKFSTLIFRKRNVVFLLFVCFEATDLFFFMNPHLIDYQGKTIQNKICRLKETQYPSFSLFELMPSSPRHLGI